MWLLNTTTLQHHLFFGSNIPPYAILSHTWAQDEVSFQDLRSPPEGIQNWGGYCKIAICCQQAKNDGFEYCWVDTCCIDKTNSAELSEAINSMYAWYKMSGKCYAYLSDVETISDLPLSRWFTRGWTLQELIAPRTITFFNKEWVQIGTRDDGNDTLMNIISATTRIPPVALTPNFELSDFSVAQIMSWASTRQTTREEDSAYCLLGLFGVHMPMIYGEGEKAFLRLQLEILKVSHDHTLFSWIRPRVNEWSSSTGPFAMAPSEFYECGNIERWSSGPGDESDYAMTNRGLCITLPVLPSPDAKYLNPNREFCALLECQEDDHQIGIYLIRLFSGQFVRDRHFELARFTKRTPDEVTLQRIYIRDPPASFTPGFNERRTRFRTPLPFYQFVFAVVTGQFIAGHWGVTENTTTSQGVWILQQHPGILNARHWRLSLHGHDQKAGLLFSNRFTSDRFAVLLGVVDIPGQGALAWVDIEAEIGANDNLQRLVANHYRKQSNYREVHLDGQATAELRGGMVARVEVDKIRVAGKIEFKVLVSILPKSGS
ncbi:uncharacterized protein PAC_18584 [Phialocephala subalpina]|uniref:Heterokaryon incompatibility domain-containing protein n=1 Tax=Phialocephala subalpina TaxID=576137 RepID=A0A1L7XUJ2_9HELO|nr:uncharacterized protein PAC_18584 [Phialocephala subalpina]